MVSEWRHNSFKAGGIDTSRQYTLPIRN